MEIIYTKLNLYRLIKDDTKLFDHDNTINFKIPFNVTKEIADKLITKNLDDNKHLNSMYM